MSRSFGRIVLGVVVALCCGSAAHAELVFADGFESGDTCGWGIGSASCPGFELRTPQVTVAAGEESVWCYYFHAPVAGTAGIRRFLSTMDAVAHDVTLYATYDASWVPADRQPPGTLSTAGCGFADELATSTYAGFLYTAHHASGQLDLPGDDGAGSPLASEILAGQPLFLEMHFINGTAQSVGTSVWIGAEALAPGTAYTKTASYLTYNASLSIPPLATNYPATYTCATPAGTQFWWLSTRTHRHGVSASVADGATTLVETTNWEDPAVTVYPAPPFHAFSGSGLTYSCFFDNPGNATIHAGNDVVTDENCVGIGYFFPATRPSLCINNIGPL